MLNFFKKNSPREAKEIDILSKTASLLIHAAKIDENYTSNEKLIIERTLIEFGARKENLDELMKLAEQYEENSKKF